MRHRKAGVKLNRTTSHRKAMLRNMVTSLFEHERVVTTQAKAKALKPLADKMITLAKRGDLHARRSALAVLTKKSVTHKLFAEIKDRYMDRPGGYTSIVRIGPRRGDAAEMAVLELLQPEQKTKSKKKTRKKRAEGKKAERKAARKAEAAPAAGLEEAGTPPETELQTETTAKTEVQGEAVADQVTESPAEEKAAATVAAETEEPGQGPEEAAEETGEKN